MNYRIEMAQARYLAELPEIARAAAALFPVEDFPLARRSEAMPVEIFENALNEQKLWLAIDADTDKAVGFALLIERCGQIHLRELDVYPEHGRQGIGTALLKNVIAWAKNKKYDQITLTTFRHLPWNAPFYAKLGFAVVEPSERSSCLTELFAEEAQGLDQSKRVLMTLDLKRGRVFSE